MSKEDLSSAHIRIAGTGMFLPPRTVTATEIDTILGVRQGWTQKHAGVAERHFVENETAAFMGAHALSNAVKGNPPDLLISAGATPQQLIPCTASLIAAEMGWNEIPCFDINATCLGFLVALDTAACMLAINRYKRIAIVCSEIASKGLNWKEPEAAAILGDGAAAVIVEKGTSELFKSHFETWPEGAELTRIKGGGSAQPACHYTKETHEDFLFHMDGPGIFRLASQKMESAVSKLIGSSPDRWSHIDAVIPHQASPLALRHMASRLKIPSEKLISIAKTCGNTIAASIPMTLHTAISTQQISRGSHILMIGTSAGFSIGGVRIQL